MQPSFRVIVNQTDERQIARPEDIDRLCADLAGRQVFIADVLAERGYEGPFLDVTVESRRAIVFYMDMDQGIKRISRDETCVRRQTVCLRSDGYPELELDQVEVNLRDIIPVDRALGILRQYLTNGEVVDLVNWPSDDEDEWGDAIITLNPPGEEIAF